MKTDFGGQWYRAWVKTNDSRTYISFLVDELDKRKARDAKIRELLLIVKKCGSWKQSKELDEALLLLEAVEA